MIRERIALEARRWLGTPYHHHARLHGVGVDCAQLLCAVYEAVGLTEHVDPGNYARNWHLHRGEELYQQWLARYGRQLPEGAPPQAGDVALFRFGRTFSHAGIVVDTDEAGVTVCHSYLGRGVILSRLTEEPLHGRPVQFWTLVDDQ